VRGSPAAEGYEGLGSEYEIGQIREVCPKLSQDLQTDLGASFPFQLKVSTCQWK
jgi:hypothetical protein